MFIQAVNGPILIKQRKPLTENSQLDKKEMFLPHFSQAFSFRERNSEMQ
jgi:hypothetical protein